MSQIRGLRASAAMATLGTLKTLKSKGSGGRLRSSKSHADLLKAHAAW